MADENPARPVPPAGKESPIEPAPVTDTVYAAPSYRSPKRRRTLVILIAVVVLLVGSFFLWRYFNSYESTDDAQADVHLYPVSARISGYVVRVNVEDNQWVEKGTVLVEIDPKDYEVAVAQAKANLSNAEATAQSLNVTVPITTVNTTSQLKFTASDIENAQAGIIAAQRQLTAAHAQLEEAEANNVRAQDDLRRYKLLVDKREVAAQIYDQALASAKSGTAAVAAASANESAAEQFVQQAQSKLAQAYANHQSAGTGPQQVSSTKSRVRAAIADVEQKRALLEQAQLNVQYTKIIAPVSGSVNKTVVVGLNLRRMRVGQRAEVHIDSSGKTLKGHIDSIAGATGPLFSLLPPENATGNYVKIVQRIPVKIVLDQGENRDHQLRPGMNVVPDVYLQ